MKVAIAGGGTGGHLFPGIALAEELRKRNAEVHFIGSESGPEARIVPQHGFPFEAIRIKKRSRGLNLKNVRAVGRLIVATWKCVGILGRIDPDVVVGTGGYVSLPVVLAGALHRIPVVIHEQNRVLGLANRVASRFASAIAVSFPMESDFGGRGHLIGNPIRNEIAKLDRSRNRAQALEHFGLDVDRKTIFVTGGSQGARNLNHSVVTNLLRWEGRSDIQFLILSGPDLEAETKEMVPPRAAVATVAFTDRMDLAYAAADLVVSRSGASTIFELAALGLPAILVPLATSLDDDQMRNAEAFADAGAAVIVRDAEAPERLGDAIDSLIDAEDRLRQMSESMKRLARPDAAEALAELVRNLGGATPTRGGASHRNFQFQRVHMVGIGGAGMSALAEILLQRGMDVSGSDLQTSDTTRHLQNLGIEVIEGHSEASLQDPDVVIYSAAIADDNPELIAARRQGIPMLTRAEALGRALEGKRVVAIAGTHGKTLTTAMTATILDMAGADPTYLIGGELTKRGSGARLGESDLVVVEADEAYGSFLHLVPAVAVILNIDIDHLDHYRDYRAIEDAFIVFMKKAGEKVLVYADDPNAMNAAARAGEFGTFGFSESADVRAADIETHASSSSFDLLVGGVSQGRIELPVPGMHRIQNALAAAAACLHLGIDVQQIAMGLATFEGVTRRFQPRGRFDGADLFDDYAHLPAEVEATLTAARLGGWKRILAVFQPHLYSRTQTFAQQFGEALIAADVVVVTDVYPARELPITGVTGKLVVDAACEASPGHRVAYMPTLDAAAEFIRSEARAGDLVVTLGAGDVTTLADRILKPKP